MLVRATHKAMDTAFAVSIVVSSKADAPYAQSAAEAAFGRIDSLERLLTRFDDSSDVAVVRALSPGDVAPVARETMDLLVLCANVCAATRGAFDPTVGPIMDKLRAPGNGVVSHRAAWGGVDDSARADALARGGMQRLVLDVDNCRVSVTPDKLGRPTPLELDFGGIGKGFALDVCAAMLADEPFCCDEFLLDAGTSTVLARGGSWRIGVGGAFKERTRRPTDVPLTNGALSGSGFDIQGQHVVDVRRSAAASRWCAAWARAESAAVADALSTAALAMSAAELKTAASELDAAFLVARNQPRAMDRLRDPLSQVGDLWRQENNGKQRGLKTTGSDPC